jgi:hypothetical protein
MRTLCIALVLIFITHVRAQAQSEPGLYVPPFQTYEPLKQKPITFAAGGVQITLEPGDPYNLSSDPDRLAVQTETGGRTTIALPEEVGQVDSISGLQDSQAAVIGMVNGSVSEVIIIDWRKTIIIDKFLCYLPAVSPDGRKIAFIKFYPPHGSDFAPRAHYMIYDAIKGESSNRSAEAHANVSVDVGTTIFPKNMENHPSDNVGKSSEPTYEHASLLYWSTDSANLIFAVSTGPDVSIVWAAFRGGDNPVVKSYAIDSSLLCGQASKVGPRDCLIVASDIGVDQTGSSVSLRLTAIGKKTATETLAYSEFQ